MNPQGFIFQLRPCSHPVQICDSNHTHSLASFQSSVLMAKVGPPRMHRTVPARNGRTTIKVNSLLSKPIYAKEQRNGPPSANWELSTAKPRHPSR